MNPSKFTLSKRATAQMEATAKSPLFSAIFRTFGNQWSEENPEGIVNAGLAENSLMHDWLTRFWERQGSLRIDHTDLTYGTSILGSDRLFKALSTYFQTYFNPLEPVLPKHIATSNGLSPMIEHVAAVIADPEDAWLIPAPYYNGFVPDLNATSQVRIASVHVPHEKCNTLAEVELMHAEMERRERDSEKQKITALLLTNPHNPLGFCYSREVLLAYCRFAERWNLFLVSDEVYANSVYDAPDVPSALPFTSVLSLNVKKDAECDPARILVLYGMSKDFGANGFRAGAMVCQHNDKLLQAISANAMTMRMGSPTDILWSALLNSDELPSYLARNQRVLSRAYTYLTTWLQAHHLPYTPANAGHFVLVDFRKHVEAIADERVLEKGEEPGRRETDAEESGRFKHEIVLLNRLVDGGVYLGPGFSYACADPGFFRVTFCIRRKELEIALERIESATIAKSISEELDPSDRLIAMSAESKLMQHARYGFWLGTFAGGMFAFRSRFSAGRDAVRAGQLPRLFFPSAQAGPGSFQARQEAAKKAAAEATAKGAKNGGEQQAEEAAAQAMRQGRAVFFGKAIAYGILGSVIGTQVGVWTGKSAANKILEDSGRKDAIERGTQRGIARAADEIAKRTGRRIDTSRAGRAIPGAGETRSHDSAFEGVGQPDDGSAGVDYTAPGRELNKDAYGGAVGYSDRAPPQDTFPGSLADSATTSATTSSAADSAHNSRWDELRRSRAAPPSKWDTLRESNARSRIPPSGGSASGPDQSSDDGYDRVERELMANRDSASERERKRKEFEAMFEREAHGGEAADELQAKPYR
ncbi:hypothetical protein B0A53_02702 [Rhodotorula sp. CCFEE 5036]|nr:hypothetical protein B0A53_02702 [Rhodotorula sp. CCFEE 5036]